MKERLFDKNRAMLQSGLAISSIGNFIFQFAISFWVLANAQDGSKATLTALVLTVGAIAKLIFVPLATNMIGSLNKRKVIIITDVLSLVFWGATALALNVFTDFNTQFMLMLVSIFMTNLFFSFNELAVHGLVRKITPEHILHKVYSAISFITNMSSLIGMALAGILFKFGGIQLVVLVNVITFAIAIALEIMVRFDETLPETRVRKNPLKNYIGFLKGFGTVRKNKEAWSLFRLTIFMLVFSVAFWQLAVRYYAIEWIQLDEDVLGYWLTAASLSSLFGPLIVGAMSKDRVLHVSRYLFVCIIVVLGTTMTVSIVGSQNGFNWFNNDISWAIFIGVMFIFRIAGQITFVSRHTAMNTTIDKDEVGRLQGMIQFWTQVITIVTLPIAGWVIDNGSINIGSLHLNGLQILVFGWIAWELFVAVMYFTNKTLKKASANLMEKKKIQ